MHGVPDGVVGEERKDKYEEGERELGEEHDIWEREAVDKTSRYTFPSTVPGSSNFVQIQHASSVVWQALTDCKLITTAGWDTMRSIDPFQGKNMV